MLELTTKQVRLLRLKSQRLSDNSAFNNASQLINHVCGLQSQELPSAYLAIRARTRNLTLEDAKKAREIDRSIVLTWAMRGTMHLVSSEDLAWLLALFGSLYIGKTAQRFKQLGLSQDIREGALYHIQDILAEHDSMTRAELAQALARHNIPVEGQAIHHLVRYAALSGLICFGAKHDGELTMFS